MAVMVEARAGTKQNMADEAGRAELWEQVTRLVWCAIVGKWDMPQKQTAMAAMVMAMAMVTRKLRWRKAAEDLLFWVQRLGDSFDMEDAIFVCNVCGDAEGAEGVVEAEPNVDVELRR